MAILEAKKEAAEGKRRMAILEASKLQTYTDVSETDTPPSGASSGASDAPSGNWKAYVDQSHAKLLRSIQKQHKDTLEKMGAMMENMKQSMDDALQQREKRLRDEFTAFKEQQKRKQSGGSGDSRKRAKPSSQDE